MFITQTGFRVAFSEKEVKNEDKSVEAGYPVFDTALYAEFTAPVEIPDKSTVILRVETRGADGSIEVNKTALEHLIGRNGESLYRAYREQNAAPGEGIPLVKWSLLEPGQIATLKALGAQTLEDFIKLPEPLLAAIGKNAHILRQKAEEAIHAQNMRLKVMAAPAKQSFAEEFHQDGERVLKATRKGGKRGGRKRKVTSGAPAVAANVEEPAHAA